MSSFAVQNQQRAMLSKVRAAQTVIATIFLANTLWSAVPSLEYYWRRIWFMYVIQFCLGPATLNRPVRAGWYVHKREPAQNHLILTSVSPQMANKYDNRILVRTLQNDAKSLLCPRSVAEINVTTYGLNKCISIAPAVWRELHSSQTTPWLTDE